MMENKAILQVYDVATARMRGAFAVKAVSIFFVITFTGLAGFNIFVIAGLKLLLLKRMDATLDKMI